jgi:DUF1009 family protein
MRTPTQIGQTIGLIAGQGSIPEALASRWEAQGLIPVIVGLKGITDPTIFKNRIAAEFSIGQAGHILNFFKSHGVTKLVMVGALKRPNFWTLRTDFFGMGIVAKLLFRQMGDDGLLRFIRREIEKFGIHVVGAHDYMPEMLCPIGALTKTSPATDDLKTIAMGFIAAKQHGADDKGQSIVVNASGVCGFETTEGTNALIESCAGQTGAILVKVSKPQQDLAFDMPTIGLSTAQNIFKAGFKGIAVEAGKTIIVDREMVVRLCDEHDLFLIGLEG